MKTERKFYMDANRYSWFSGKDRKAGWEQFDTDHDAWYFGVWINPKTLQTRTYAEGDLTTVTCENKQTYENEVRKMMESYGKVV